MKHSAFSVPTLLAGRQEKLAYPVGPGKEADKQVTMYNYVAGMTIDHTCKFTWCSDNVGGLANM